MSGELSRCSAFRMKTKIDHQRQVEPQQTQLGKIKNYYEKINNNSSKNSSDSKEVIGKEPGK